MLKSLKICNLLSFGPASQAVPLGRLNVIIGPNGSGKSNFIEAISLLQAAPDDLVLPVREGGGIHEWLWKGTPASSGARIEAMIDYKPELGLRYDLWLAEEGQRLVVADERLSAEQDGTTRFQDKDWVRMGAVADLPPWTLDPERSFLSLFVDPRQHPEVAFVEQAFSAIRLYRDWTFGRHAPPRRPQPADLPNRYLEEDGRNLGLILNRLRKDAATKQALMAGLRELYQDIQDVDVSIEGGTVQVFLQEAGRTIPASRLSDGTVHWLCLLAVLLHPGLRLCCIEEPEVGLHPDLLPVLARLLRSASERMQLIVTTHSDVLVDALNDMPESVLVCEKQDGGSVLKRLDQGRGEDRQGRRLQGPGGGDQGHQDQGSL